MKLSNSETQTFIMYITKISFINNNDHFSKASFPYTRFLPARLRGNRAVLDPGWLAAYMEIHKWQLI